MKNQFNLVAMLLLGATVAFLNAGCSTESKVAANPSTEVMPSPKILTARGYGTTNRDQMYRLNPAQRKLMAIRASKMDALRELAEQVYGVRLKGQTTVEEMAVKNDSYRAYVDAFIRGAHVKTTSASAIDRDSYETVMELELTPAFYQCLLGNGQCVYQTSYAAPTSRVVAAPMFYPNQPNANPSIDKINLDCSADDCYHYPDTKGFN